MFDVKTLNAISRHALARFPKELYRIDADGAEPDAILVRSADLHGMDLPASVKAIGRAGAGTNNIPVAELSKRGIVVFNAPGANANAVRELVLAGMLLAVRNLPEALRFVEGLDREHPDLDAYVESQKKRFVGSELAGRTLGVVGLGAIGVKVANAARALGMRVLGFDPHMTVDGAWRLSSEVGKAGSLAQLYAESDFISLHVPLNAETKGLFGPQALATVRRGVVLLNFAREGVVEAKELRAALDEGLIGRYVCDFPAVELLGHPRVIALPHLGASTVEAEENCGVMVVDQVRDFLEHGHISNSVNFPSLHLPRSGRQRVCIANRNVPNMIGQLSHAFGAAGLNIAQMQNASRGDLAYTVIDLDGQAGPAVIGELEAIAGVLAVRVL